MELPGKRELREQILHQMDGRTSYVSDKDVYREIDNTEVLDRNRIWRATLRNPRKPSVR